MSDLKNFYTVSIAKCENLTQECVTSTHALLTSIKYLEKTYSTASDAVFAATAAMPYANQTDPHTVSLPAFMLEKETANLMCCLEDLKRIVTVRLGVVLQELNELLSVAVASSAVSTIPGVSELYRSYRRVLVNCIATLRDLEVELSSFTSA
jgi:hypothetical protein